MDFNCEKPRRVYDKRYRYQLFSTLSVSIISFSHGLAIGWLAPMLSKMQSINSPIDFPVSVSDASWIGSLIGVGSLIGNIIFGFLMDWVGRKPCIQLLAVPHMLHWTFIYFASSTEYLYAARVLGGITGGGLFLVIPIFVGEIAEQTIRGRLASMFTLSFNTGILVGFIAASYIPYHVIPCLVIVMPILYLVLSFNFPETPQYLLRNSRDVEAELSFRFYRNCLKNRTNAAIIDFDNKFHELKGFLNHNQETKKEKTVLMKELCKKRSLKAISMGLTLCVFSQFSGIYFLINYMSTVFLMAGTKVDPNTNTIITGVVQIFGAYIATHLIDCHGRKILMIVSFTGTSIGMSTFGLYAFLAQRTITSYFNWLPLVIMSFIIFISNIGFASVLSVILVEILPPKIRSMGSFICCCCMSLMVFICLKIFPMSMESFGLPTTMFGFSIVSVLATIFIYFVLPETKGKSVDNDEEFK